MNPQSKQLGTQCDVPHGRVQRLIVVTFGTISRRIFIGLVWKEERKFHVQNCVCSISVKGAPEDKLLERALTIISNEASTSHPYLLLVACCVS